MAVGRISGPLLKSNLIRNGVDLAFETDLLYLDVNNQRIGVRTASPSHELQVNGTAKTTNLIVDTTANLADVTIEGNTISTTLPLKVTNTEHKALASDCVGVIIVHDLERVALARGHNQNALGRSDLYWYCGRPKAFRSSKLPKV